MTTNLQKETQTENKKNIKAIIDKASAKLKAKDSENDQIQSLEDEDILLYKDVTFQSKPEKGEVWKSLGFLSFDYKDKVDSVSKKASSLDKKTTNAYVLRVKGKGIKGKLINGCLENANSERNMFLMADGQCFKVVGEEVNTEGKMLKGDGEGKTKDDTIIRMEITTCVKGVQMKPLVEEK
eukprot:CAMPEP_0170520828 /NCGR_PEP_ID=MMETSP0209-20121228/6161_1 /TAXON_ID=665100 ORGANISM="Litonotus pictus, Strain P1" /NCGR_SAMPLE_ID=MMETSP0209 /ASSEMBLY_ACC=CAM_ASM_000301 /LENGTH=180 /DNA_ID=CAMNT_0010807383 /DNA_START=278 /DNA_END=817 /DNA_ORIENTATION=-